MFLCLCQRLDVRSHFFFKKAEWLERRTRKTGKRERERRYPSGSNTNSKQNKTKQNKTKQNKTKQNKTKQNKTTRTYTNDKSPFRERHWRDTAAAQEDECMTILRQLIRAQLYTCDDGVPSTSSPKCGFTCSQQPLAFKTSNEPCICYTRVRLVASSMTSLFGPGRWIANSPPSDAARTSLATSLLQQEAACHSRVSLPNSPRRSSAITKVCVVARRKKWSARLAHFHR